MHKTKKIMMIVLFAVFMYLATSLIWADGKTYIDVLNQKSIAPIDSTFKTNRYTQKEASEPAATNPYTSIKDHELIGSVTTDLGEELAFYLNETYLSIRIVNVTTGYVWASTMEFDYLDETHELYNENDVPGSGEATNMYVKRYRSPVVIQYYNLKDSTRSEEYFFERTAIGTKSGFKTYTLEQDDKVGFETTLIMPFTKIQFAFKVYINEQGLNVEIPNESIKEPDNYKISSLSFYRFLGFSKEDVTPGYLLIPDGTGALIRFEEGMTDTTYMKKYYGNDLGLNQSLDEEETLNARMYGIVQGVNEHAMLAVIKEGAGNATFSFTPANKSQTDFHSTSVIFEYRTTYTQKLNASGTSKATLIQGNKNTFDVHMQYRFLSGEQANYVGMANEYRKVLIEEGYQLEKNSESNISLHADVLAAESKKAFIGRKVFTMTTVNELIQMIEDMQNRGIEALDISYHGWNDGGNSRVTPEFDSFESKVGSKSEFLKLNKLENVNMYYVMNQNIAHEDASGYRSSNVMQTIGKELLKTESFYYIKTNQALNYLTGDYQKVSKWGVTNVHLDTFGTMLTSDYATTMITRSEQIDQIRKSLEVASQTAVTKPFDYLWDADVIVDIPLYSSQQLKFTDTVPFMSYVLAGHQRVYGRSSNFFSNTSNELLRMVDYHIFPSFYLTHESANQLLNTDMEHIFTSRYHDWKEEVERQYHFVNNALKYVIGHTIESRTILENGVIRNRYDHGVRIYINYTGHVVTVDGIILQPMSYEVIQ